MAIEKAATAAACILLCACAGIKGYPDRSFTAVDDLAALKQYQTSQALEKYDADSPASRGGMTRESWRNEVLEARIQDINLHFDDFEQSLYEQGVGFGIGTDWILLGLTGGGAVAAKGLANALSATAAGVTGARASYDKEALYNKTLIVLLGQMVAQRQSVLVTIRSGEKLDSASYPLTRGLADVDTYYNAGTVPGALISVSANSGEQSKQAQLDLKKLNTVPVVNLVPADIEAEKQAILPCVRKLSDKAAGDVLNDPAYAKLLTDLGATDYMAGQAVQNYTAEQKIQYILSVAKTSDQVKSIASLTKCTEAK